MYINLPTSASVYFMELCKSLAFTVIISAYVMLPCHLGSRFLVEKRHNFVESTLQNKNEWH